MNVKSNIASSWAIFMINRIYHLKTNNRIIPLLLIHIYAIKSVPFVVKNNSYLFRLFIKNMAE